MSPPVGVALHVSKWRLSTVDWQAPFKLFQAPLSGRIRAAQLQASGKKLLQKLYDYYYYFYPSIAEPKVAAKSI